MDLEISYDSLPVFEALSSKIRIDIIKLLSKEKLSNKEIAERLEISSAIVTMHIKKLEEASIISTERVGKKKISSLRVDEIDIHFPEKIFNAFDTKDSYIPVGHYTNYEVTAPCGLASPQEFIGNRDDPKLFMDTRRMDAGIIWFTQGFVEYQSPNYIEKENKVEMIEISMEISSEFPFYNNNWPSDITFYLNDIELGTWTSPGDYGDIRGKLTPAWYPDNLNQYGLLKTIRITKHLTNMDGEPLSPITISDIPTHTERWKLRFEVKEDAKNVGGCTLFGKSFGNYAQDISLKAYYS
ncbi:ArsR/SmtB family transcription factor [Enterococcus diestrammenae]|uniref:ArsR/SmtB family transcription factor n=1 Tax=Enterococcus diestrammenae TaxID=1155073 RepID=UPI00195B683E